MKNILDFKTFGLLEHVIFDYRKVMDTDKSIKYEFNANGEKYFLTIWHDESKHDFGVYEVEFGFRNQKSSGERAGKDLKHLNSVLNTVCEIIEIVVKDKKIETIRIEGAGDRKDTGMSYDDNIRSNIYLRFLTNKYSTSAIKNIGRWITVDMTKVFPELFKDKKNRIELVVDELVRLSDEDPNREGIMRGVSGISEEQFDISTDFILNSKFGSLYIEIQVWDAPKEFYISWNKMDEDEEGSENFKSFDELLNYLKNFK